MIVVYNDMVKELVEHIVQKLVDKPEAVQIEQRIDGNKEMLDIRVDASDRGKVIGKQGQTIKAIRALIHILAPQDKKIVVDIV